MKNASRPSKEGNCLLYKFIGQIFVVPRKWYPDERLTLHRVFPDLLFEMFQAWYTQSHPWKGAKYIDKLFPDLDIFTREFEEIITDEYDLGCEQRLSSGEYALSRHDFRYTLSKCRFSKLGLTIYASVLDGGDSISDNPE